VVEKEDNIMEDGKPIVDDLDEKLINFKSANLLN
jgi:hypothetical protein